MSDSNTPPYIQTHGLSCTRSDHFLLRNVSFVLNSGQLLQIHGRNGSGKTTLLHLLAGLVLPESGVIQRLGRNIDEDKTEYRRQLFYLGHQSAVKASLTVRENLSWLGLLHGHAYTLSQLSELSNQLDLKLDQSAESLSAGQRRRVALASLFYTSAKLWLLDEPFTALDKEAQAWVIERIDQQLTRGGCVILSSHQTLPDHQAKTWSVQRLELSS